MGKELCLKQEETAPGARKLYSQQIELDAELRLQSSRQPPFNKKLPLLIIATKGFRRKCLQAIWAAISVSWERRDSEK